MIAVLKTVNASAFVKKVWSNFPERPSIPAQFDKYVTKLEKRVETLERALNIPAGGGGKRVRAADAAAGDADADDPWDE